MKITEFRNARADADEYMRLKEWCDSLRKRKDKEVTVKLEYEGSERGSFHISTNVFVEVLEGQMEAHAKRLRTYGVEV